MLGLFRKKTPSKQERAQKLNELAQTFIAPQLVMGNATAADLLSHQWSLGYVFGVHDAAYQRAGVNDDVDCIAFLTMSFIDYFGGSDDGLLQFEKSSIRNQILSFWPVRKPVAATCSCSLGARITCQQH